MTPVDEARAVAGRAATLHALLVVACLLSGAERSLAAQSEGAVRGHVVAAVDGSSLVGAVVTLTPSTGDSAQRRSEPDGGFGFANVRPGSYVLSVSCGGFRTRDLPFVLEPRETRTFTVALDVASLALTIDVAGSLAPLPGTHSPSSTTLTAERLESLPVFQRLTLSDAVVTLAPGMIRGHDDFVHIRGHEVALNPLINGVSFWENTHALFSAGMNPAIIETANVMTGGFAAEYGNRFGGVVDIVTRSGLRLQDRATVTMSGGDAGRARVEGDVGGRRGRLGVFLFGALLTSGRLLSPPDPTAIHDRGDAGHAFLQLDGDLGRGGTVKAILMGDGTNLEIPRTPLDVELRPLATPGQTARQQTAILGWTKASGRAVFSASLYQRSSRVQLSPAVGPLTARAQLDRSLDTVGGKVDATRFQGRHTLRAGLDVVSLRPREHLAYDDAGYLAFTHLLGVPHVHVAGQAITFDGAESGGQVSAYAQDVITMGRLTADVGLRIDRYDLLVSETHASPRLNLAWRMRERTVIHASYNHFFVPPPIEGVLSSSAGLTRMIEEIGVPLAKIEPTVEDQFEAGTTTAFGYVQAAVTGYYRVTDNPVHTTVWPDSRVYSYASFHRARAYGIEAKLDVRPPVRSGLTGYLNYALGRAYFYNPVTGGFVTEAGHVTDSSRFQAPMDQTHTLTGGLSFRHASTGLWCGGTVEYGSGTPMGHGGAHDHGAGAAAHTDPASGAPAPRVPAHFTAGVSVGVDLLRAANRRGKVTLQFDVENVANDVYLIAQEGEFSPAQFSIPRLFAVTAKFRF